MGRDVLSVLGGSLHLCLGTWIVAGGDWFVLHFPLCVLRDVFPFPKGDTFRLDLLCHIAEFKMCLIQLCKIIASSVAPFPVTVSISQKEAVKRETKAEPAPRTAKRYYC